MLAGLLILTVATPAAAQRLGEDELAVVLAALPHVRASLPAGTAVLDPELFCAPRLAGWSCPAELRSAASGLGLALHGRAFTMVCPGAPPSCRLVNAESLILFHPPRLDGNDARVRVSTWRRASRSGRSVSERSRLIRLARDGAGWRVVAEEAAR